MFLILIFQIMLPINYSQYQNSISMEVPRKLLQLIVERANQRDIYHKALEVGCVQYQLKSYNILRLTPNKILTIFDNLNLKYYCHQIEEKDEEWHENQLRVFVWLLVVYMYINNKSLSHMNYSDWCVFTQIFKGKSPQTLQFQGLCLNRRRRTPKWTEQETELLIEIINQKEEKHRWNDIAKKIFIRSRKKFFRTPKQCRQQWINHLDPTKIKSKWTAVEDYQMMVCILEHGKKWSRVAKELGGTRTEHMVKNRFNSIIKNQTRKSGLELSEYLLISKIKQRLESSIQIKNNYSRKANKKETKKNQNDEIGENNQQIIQKSAEKHDQYSQGSETKKQNNEVLIESDKARQKSVEEPISDEVDDTEDKMCWNLISEESVGFLDLFLPNNQSSNQNRISQLDYFFSDPQHPSL